LFERANEGSVFLDEVGEMSPNMQVRLLRVLESGEVLRVGGIKSFKVNVRVIAATNQNLESAVRNGKFRQDLFYRLKGVTFYMSPLRERLQDIPLLIDQFIILANSRHQKEIKGIESAALRKLTGYDWPGNIRELRNLIDTLVVLESSAKITSDLVSSRLKEVEKSAPDLLPITINRSKEEAEREMIYASIIALHRDVSEILKILRHQEGRGPWEGMREVYAQSHEPERTELTLEKIEREAIQRALRQSGGNRRKASEMLGISERTLYRKIKEYGLI
jgi:transcriptional regulator with PAS, ATPase and Fis domain